MVDIYDLPLFFPSISKVEQSRNNTARFNITTKDIEPPVEDKWEILYPNDTGITGQQLLVTLYNKAYNANTDANSAVAWGVASDLVDNERYGVHFLTRSLTQSEIYSILESYFGPNCKPENWKFQNGKSDNTLGQRDVDRLLTRAFDKESK